VGGGRAVSRGRRLCACTRVLSNEALLCYCFHYPLLLLLLLLLLPAERSKRSTRSVTPIVAAIPPSSPTANSASRNHTPQEAHPVEHNAGGAALGVLGRLLLVLHHELAACAMEEGGGGTVRLGGVLAFSPRALYLPIAVLCKRQPRLRHHAGGCPRKRLLFELNELPRHH